MMLNILFPKFANILSGLLFFSLLTCLTLSFTLLPVQSHAQDYYQSRSVNAGFYLRMPFGPTKKNEDRLKYGLRLNMTQNFSNSPQWRDGFRLDNSQYINMDLMSLNFSEGGFQNLSFAGQKTLIYQNGILRAADEGENGGGTSTFVWILGGIGIVSIGVITAVAIDVGNRCSPDYARASPSCD